MGAGITAVINSKKMVQVICELGQKLGLDVRKNVKAGETIWTTERRVKIVLKREVEGQPKKILGVDCVCQHGPGTAYVKAPTKLMDIKQYPFPGVLVYTGPGIPEKFKGVLSSFGAVALENFETWLRQFFNI